MPNTTSSITVDEDHLRMVREAHDWADFARYGLTTGFGVSSITAATQPQFLVNTAANTWAIVNKAQQSISERVSAMSDTEYEALVKQQNTNRLRRRARSRLEDKEYAWNGGSRRWRDHGSYKYEIIGRKDRRKAVALNVSKLIKESKGDDLKLLGALHQYSTCDGADFSWYTRLVQKRWGVDILDAFRFSSDWVRPVWDNERWFRDSIWSRVHQVHQSEDNPSQIAYNRSLDNVKRNIQTRTKPGKYLTQFFGDVLNENQIREWAEKQIAFASCRGTLKFVENDNPDEWVHVYENGPQSCMKGQEAVKVYCYPGNGLRLAYIESSCGEIVARTIVRNNKEGIHMGYIRTYGTEHRWHTKLLEDLAAAGYSDQTNMDGVRLARINCRHDYDPDGVMCPYIDTGYDGTQHVSIYDDYLLVDDDGDICANNTCGSIPLHDNTYDCEHCGETVDEEDTTYVDSVGERVCQTCLGDDFTYARGRRYMDYFPNDEVIHCESDDEYYQTAYANNHSVYECADTGDWYHVDDLVMCDFGQYEGSFIHNDRAEQDNRSDEWGHRHDLTKLNGWWVNDEYLQDCHITGDTFDVRDGVTIDMGLFRNSWGGYSHNKVFISPEAWTLDLIRQHFVECGGHLFPAHYMGNELSEPFTPKNIEYGDESDLELFEDMLETALAEYAEAA